MGLPDDPPAVRPLTLVRRGGEPYRRDTGVEAQIARSIGLSAAVLRTRANIDDKSSSEYLQEECLVHLLRAAARRDDKIAADAAADLLLRRCQSWVTRRFRRLGVATADIDDLYDEVVTNVMSAILGEGDRGDFYEVRFWTALKRQLLKVFDAYRRRRRREGGQESLSAPIATGGDGGEDGACLEDTLPSKSNVLEDLASREEIVQALSRIKDPRHRKAYVLHHYEGWQIESQTDWEPSLSALFNVTPRTVCNWLRAAEADLGTERETKGIPARSQP